MIMRWRLDLLAVGGRRWFPANKRAAARQAIRYYSKRMPGRIFDARQDMDGEYRVTRIL